MRAREQVLGDEGGSNDSGGDGIWNADDGAQNDTQGTQGKGEHDKRASRENPVVCHEKLESFGCPWNERGLSDFRSFSTPFPQYRGKYIRGSWPLVTRALKEHSIACELNLVENRMMVSTTRKTQDPFMIIKARDLITLLSQSVPVAQAVKILEDDNQCDAANIGYIRRNKERYRKRRQQLLGLSGATSKVIELFTDCYLLVQVGRRNEFYFIQF